MKQNLVGFEWNRTTIHRLTADCSTIKLQTYFIIPLQGPTGLEPVPLPSKGNILYLLDEGL